MKRIKIAIGLLVLLAVLVFALQNSPIVQVKFLAWGLELSLSLIIFTTFGAGILIGWGGSSLARLSRGTDRP